jgi:hypothetical protein
MPDQFRCEHGHAYYDGDQGVGSPYDDGLHDGLLHSYDFGVESWDDWERDQYDRGFNSAGPEAGSETP